MTSSVSRSAVAATLLLIGSAACAPIPEPFAGPRVVAGSERTVSIAAGKLTDTSGVAERYCANFGRKAESRGRGPLNEDKITVIHYYDCVGSIDDP